MDRHLGGCRRCEFFLDTAGCELRVWQLGADRREFVCNVVVVGRLPIVTVQMLVLCQLLVLNLVLLRVVLKSNNLSVHFIILINMKTNLFEGGNRICHERNLIKNYAKHFQRLNEIHSGIPRSSSCHLLDKSSQSPRLPKLAKNHNERQTEIMRENVSLIQRIQRIQSHTGNLHPARVQTEKKDP